MVKMILYFCFYSKFLKKKSKRTLYAIFFLITNKTKLLVACISLIGMEWFKAFYRDINQSNQTNLINFLKINTFDAHFTLK